MKKIAAAALAVLLTGCTAAETAVTQPVPDTTTGTEETTQVTVLSEIETTTKTETADTETTTESETTTVSETQTQSDTETETETDRHPQSDVLCCCTNNCPNRNSYAHTNCQTG